MEWVVVTIAILVASVGWWYLGSHLRGRNKRRSDFQGFIRSLMCMLDNGGILRIEQRGSPVAFDFVRTKGSGVSAVVELQIPKMAWAKDRLTQLREGFVNNGLEPREDPTCESSILVSIRFPVEDIWLPWSGAKPARAAHLMIDVVDVDDAATFNISLLGDRTLEWLKNRSSRH